jgi:hypothetical protein
MGFLLGGALFFLATPPLGLSFLLFFTSWVDLGISFFLFDGVAEGSNGMMALPTEGFRERIYYV